MTSPEIRTKLVEALKLDLVGPWPGHPFANELLPENPTRWYLTGYLVPESAPVEQRSDAEAKEQVDAGGEGGGMDDGGTPARAATPAAALARVCRLRALHASMDAAVLTAHGWTDLLPKCTCQFLLDYEEEESESGADESAGRKKKKPWRYRWADEVRDEVLALLLKLNAERAEQERLAGLATAAAPATVKRAKKKSSALAQGDLIEPPQKDLFA